MINLLPPEYRSGLRYARLNGLLVRWLVLGVILIAGLMLILVSGWLYMNQEISNLEQNIKAAESQLKEQKIDEVSKQADEISQNIRTINLILNREIRFSELIQEIGEVMPKGAVLNSLSISQVNGALDLEVSTKDQPAAAQVAVNLSDPKKDIFDTVDIIDIKCTKDVAYPCIAKYKALFGKNTPTRFVNIATEDNQ